MPESPFMENEASTHPQRKKNATRTNLLSAAVRLFGEQGFAGASTRAIAKEAGCNIGLIAFYFEGKQGLYEAARDIIFERVSFFVSPMTERLEKLLKAGATPSLLMQGIQTEMYAIIQRAIETPCDPNLFLLLRRSLQEADKQSNALYSKLFIPLLNVLEDILVVATNESFRRRAHLSAFLVIDTLIGILRDYPSFSPHVRRGNDMENDPQLLTDILITSIRANFPITTC